MARSGRTAGAHSPALRTLFALSICLYAFAFAVHTAHAQNTIGGGATAGVSVDADGVLKRVTETDQSGDLARQRIAEALGKLDQNVAKHSPMRKISLTRLSPW